MEQAAKVRRRKVPMDGFKNLPEDVYDVIIIGGGPAGLTAAIYASRARMKTLLIESFSLPSQAVTTSRIENYPGFPEGIGGFELLEGFKKQAKDFGAEFAVGSVKAVRPCEKQNVCVWEVEPGDASGNTDSNGVSKRYKALSLIVAAGARPKELGVPGEERLKGRGVSYCATCDGAFFKDKDIVVIGGGDTAVEEALFLTRFGKKVILIHRRDKLRATKILQERAFSNKKVDVLWNSVVEEVLGADRVEAVKVMNLKTGAGEDISCDAVFVFAGLVPNVDFVKEIVKLDSNGYVIVDSAMMASQEGIFACGDCRQTYLRQIVTACGDGAVAAFSAQQYVDELKGVGYNSHSNPETSGLRAH